MLCVGEVFDVKGSYGQEDVFSLLHNLMGYMLGEARRDVINKGIYLSTISKFEKLSLVDIELSDDRAEFIVNYVSNYMRMVNIFGDSEEVSLLNILMDELYDILVENVREGVLV